MPTPLTITSTGEGGINTVFVEAKPGDPIMAKDWNAVRTTVQAMSQIGRADGEEVLVNGAGRFHMPNQNVDGIPFYNGDAAITIPAYAVILITDKKVSGGNSVPSCQRPNTYGCQNNFLVNGPAAVAGNKYGLAQTGPLYKVWYNGTNPGIGTMWGPIANTYQVQPNSGGFWAIGDWDATNKIMLAKSLPMLSFRGQPTADVAAAASGTVNVYTGAFGSEAIYTGQSVSNVRNDSSCTVKGSKICTCVYVPDNGGWQFDQGKTS